MNQYLGTTNFIVNSMLNFQIRGNQINISICEISTINLTETLDEIRTHKKSLAEVVLNKGIDSFEYYYNMTKPILNDNSELIVSSFDINNYYDEGHSFYRNKLISSNFMQTIRNYFIKFFVKRKSLAESMNNWPVLTKITKR